ncbi:hypothetical protein M885DRAFT_473768 [Pelagophyceae sp. CCMP2097]|nr:hypothetical protein M885DRAFT_473768 [Pelagophyceae sp. CCMP2097]
MAADAAPGEALTFYIETRGCQMNVSDSEVVRSILLAAGFEEKPSPDEAWVTLLNTCAIREKAELKVWSRLSDLRKASKSRKIAVLGCMAERIKEELFSRKLVDVVAGPDSYRELPRLFAGLGGGTRIETQLSLEETYADVVPVRADAGKKHGAFVSIQRGCDNMCSYCIVPFVRGRERSRPVSSVVDECRTLYDEGVREITLLGQNVNSYGASLESPLQGAAVSAGEKRSYSVGFDPFIRHQRRDDREACRFAELLQFVAEAAPEARIRFTSPHPKDFPDALLDVISMQPNVAKQIHLPAQSGSDEVLQRMRRGYTGESYRALASRAHAKIPGLALSSDFIAGFSGETEADHAATVDLLRQVEYDMAFIFAYSLRPKTHAARHLEDDVPREVKFQRLNELLAEFHAGRARIAAAAVGGSRLVLVEGAPRRTPAPGPHLTGRDDAHRKVIFAADDAAGLMPGDFVHVRIDSTNGTSLFGTVTRRAAAGARG